jgi:hypothetical protein
VSDPGEVGGLKVNLAHADNKLSMMCLILRLHMRGPVVNVGIPTQQNGRSGTTQAAMRTCQGWRHIGGYFAGAI